MIKLINEWQKQRATGIDRGRDRDRDREGCIYWRTVICFTCYIYTTYISFLFLFTQFLSDRTPQPPPLFIVQQSFLFTEGEAFPCPVCRGRGEVLWSLGWIRSMTVMRQPKAHLGKFVCLWWEIQVSRNYSNFLSEGRKFNSLALSLTTYSICFLSFNIFSCFESEEWG